MKLIFFIDNFYCGVYDMNDFDYLLGLESRTHEKSLDNFILMESRGELNQSGNDLKKLGNKLSRWVQFDVIIRRVKLY